MSYYSNDKKKSIIILSIISVVLLLGLLLFILLSRDKNNEYKVNFYDNTTIIGSFTLDEDERVTQSIIDEVLSRIETDFENYSYVWSFNNSELIEVNFDQLNYDSDIYLHKVLKDKYEITVEKNDFFGYEIIASGPLTENSSASIIINSNVEEDHYKIYVYANNVEIFADENGYYQINNITEDINIKVEYLEILNIVSNMNDSYIYNGENIDITYQVFNLNNELIDINNSDIEIKVYDELNNLVSEINNSGQYKVVYEYIGDDYYIEKVEKEISVNKEKLTIKPLYNDSYDYNNNPINVDYQILNSNNEIININESDIKITYYDSNNQEFDNIINAGNYKVKYQYVGSLYDIEDVEINIIVNKIKPTISVENKKFTYDGTIKKFEITDVITNSNGEIKFINNENINAGTYEVQIEISESNNYLATSTTAYITINKAATKAINLPTTSLGYEGDTLERVDIIGGEFNTEGSFIWNDESEELVVGKKEYRVKFVPTDINNYEICQMNISVETISYEETLLRIKEDREIISGIIGGTFGEKLSIEEVLAIKNIPLIGLKYQSSITWYSNSNVVSIDHLGNIKYLDVPGIHNITLIGYFRLGNTVEYLRYLVTIEIPEKLENVNLNQTENIDLDIEKNKNNDFEETVIKEHQYEESDKVEQLVIITPTNNYDNYIINITDESIEEKQNKEEIKLEVSYETLDGYHEKISEVILWKILTDGASDDNNNINLENKAKDIQKYMKGEHNIWKKVYL